LANWTETTADIAGTTLALVRGGSGTPLLILHEELGHPGWMTWNEELAKERELIIPLQPGCGKTLKLDWIRSYRGLLRTLMVMRSSMQALRNDGSHVRGEV